MITESYCDYYQDRSIGVVMCPIVIYGPSHIHTECRACKHNIYGFYETLAIIRKKLSNSDPVFTGILPFIQEDYSKNKYRGVLS